MNKSHLWACALVSVNLVVLVCTFSYFRTSTNTASTVTVTPEVQHACAIRDVNEPDDVAAASTSSTMWATTLQQDRPVIIQATYGNIDLTYALRKLHFGRRFRIPKQMDLKFLLGWVGATQLAVTYEYRGERKQVDIPLQVEDGHVFLTQDLLIPSNLTEDVVLQTGVSLTKYLPLVQGKAGFEIGGPSRIFDTLGLYGAASSMDNANFAENTLWEKELFTGKPFVFHKDKPPGTQFVANAMNLSVVREHGKKYDFIVSSHMMEHVPNPLLAVKEMLSVLVSGGYFITIVPYKSLCFDHYRDYTLMQELVDIYEGRIPDVLQYRFNELLFLHDLGAHMGGGNFPAFLLTVWDTHSVAPPHLHVFHFELLQQMGEWANLELVALERQDLHILGVFRKP